MSKTTAVAAAVAETRDAQATVGDKRPRHDILSDRGDKAPHVNDLAFADQENLFDNDGCDDFPRRPSLLEADEVELCMDDFLQQPTSSSWQKNNNSGNPTANDGHNRPVAVPSASTAAAAAASPSTTIQSTHATSSTTNTASTTTAPAAPIGGPPAGGLGRPPITFKKFRSGALATASTSTGASVITTAGASVSASGGSNSGSTAATPSPLATTTPNPSSRRSTRAVD